MGTPTPPFTPPLGRNFTLQILRGTQQQIQQAIPFSWGELYFAEDTGNLFCGTPGVGIGYVQIGDMTGMNDTLLQILTELKVTRQLLERLLQQLGGDYASPTIID